MARVGGCLVCCLMLMAFVAGCRTPQPVVKPPPQPEVLTKPPNLERYSQSTYPEQAFKGMDSRFARPNDSGGILPARGMQAAPGMSGGPGMGGMGSGPGGGYR